MKISTRDFRLGNYDFYFHSWHNGFYLSKKSLCFISIYTVISYHTSVRLAIPKKLDEHDFCFQIQIFAKLVRKNINVSEHERLLYNTRRQKPHVYCHYTFVNNKAMVFIYQ